MISSFKKTRIAIIGVGAVGSTTAYTLLLRERMDELVLIDANKAKAIGDALDMNHGLPFVVGFCLLAGVVFSMIDKAASRMRTPMAIMIMRVLSAGTGVITTLMLLQYHLRSVARLLEVAFVLVFVMRWVDRRLARRRRERTPKVLRRAVAYEP